MKYKSHYLLIFILLLKINFSANAQLSGTYQIGPNAPKYKTINQAVQDLYLQHGVKGPVIFNIEDGVYEEQIYIPIINNASVNNLVTFQSLSGDSSKVIIRFKPKNDTFNYTLMLDGSSYLVFKDLTFRTDTVFGRVIDINNQCTFNQFKNNRIIGMPGSRELVYSESNSGSMDNYNRFENNFFLYGSAGIRFQGIDNSSHEQGNELLKNFFLDQSEQGIDMKYSTGFKIRQNTIISGTGMVDYSAIRIQYCSDKFFIEKNKIDIRNKQFSSHGISLIFSFGTTDANASLIANNFIHIESSTYVYAAGIDILGSHKNFFFNSIHLSGKNEAGACFNDISATNLNICNNIFANTADGLALVLNDTQNIKSNYNDLYGTGMALTSDGTNYYSTLSDWKTASGRDTSSLSTNPVFFGKSDLHIYNYRLTKRGIGIPGINDDIDGNGRKQPKPDIGADEFSYRLNLGADRNVCNGQNIIIRAEKGFDTYLWHDGSTSDTITIDSSDATSGVVNVKLSVTYQTDFYTDSMLINFVVPHASLGPDKAVCEEEPVTLQATGGVKFIWSTGDTTSTINFIAGKSDVYSVVVTDQFGCRDSASVWVNVKGKPVTPSIIPLGNDSLKSSIAGSSYKWFLNNTLLNDKTITIKAKTNGIYQLMVADSACYSDTSEGYDYKKSSIENPSDISVISIYPNPVSDVLIVDVSCNNPSGSQIEIISALGKMVWQSNQITQHNIITTSALKKGLYILRFTSGNHMLIKRFVVEK